MGGAAGAGWFVLAWDAFEAPQFPIDEALRLARVVGLDLDDVLQDLDAIRDVVNSLQPSLLTLADLEAILRQPALLPPGCSARPIGAYDFAWTQPGLDEEMRVTCNASYYEDNSDSCELWVPGSPLFPDRQSLEASLGCVAVDKSQFIQLIGN